MPKEPRYISRACVNCGAKVLTDRKFCCLYCEDDYAQNGPPSTEVLQKVYPVRERKAVKGCPTCPHCSRKQNSGNIGTDCQHCRRSMV